MEFWRYVSVYMLWWKGEHLQKENQVINYLSPIEALRLFSSMVVKVLPSVQAAGYWQGKATTWWKYQKLAPWPERHRLGSPRGCLGQFSVKAYAVDCRVLILRVSATFVRYYPICLVHTKGIKRKRKGVEKKITTCWLAAVWTSKTKLKKKRKENNFVTSLSLICVWFVRGTIVR